MICTSKFRDTTEKLPEKVCILFRPINCNAHFNYYIGKGSKFDTLSRPAVKKVGSAIITVYTQYVNPAHPPKLCTLYTGSTNWSVIGV